MLQMMQIWMMVIFVEPQAKHLRGLELEKGVGASELVGRMEQAGAHPLHHSVIGGWVTPHLLRLTSFLDLFSWDISQKKHKCVTIPPQR